jgi:hypothetical protein
MRKPAAKKAAKLKTKTKPKTKTKAKIKVRASRLRTKTKPARHTPVHRKLKPKPKPKLKSPAKPFRRVFTAGTAPDDVEVLLGKVWSTATSIRVSEDDGLVWRSPYFFGACPARMWRPKKTPI